MSLRSKVNCGSEVFSKLRSQLTRMRKYVERQNTGLFFFNQYLQRKKKGILILCTQYANTGLNAKLRFPRLYSFLKPHR